MGGRVVAVRITKAPDGDYGLAFVSQVGGAVGHTLRVDEIKPVVGQLADQCIRGYPEMSYMMANTRPWDRDLITKGREISSRQVGEKALKEDAIEMIFLHPFKMAHHGLLLVGGKEFRR